MAKRGSRSIALDFSFFAELWRFYQENRGTIRRHYRELTKRFLDYNDPDNSHAFLRTPQFEALEIYIFLKEYLNNAPLHRIFREWAGKRQAFEGRTAAARAGQLDMFEELTREDYDAVFDRMSSNARPYPNYIFALTMGTGKTILMATCIFYEFILANKWPRDQNYCHNALVFAPDTTVLQSLREMMTFDMAKVVPPEYVSFLNANVQFHFLDEPGTSLSTIDHSRFNLIISNTQKIILKRQHAEKTPMEKLMGSGKPTYDTGTVYDEYADLYELEPEDENDLATNQRFEKIRRLEQLGIYVDEAHHAFGRNLARDVGAQEDTRKTSLRNTIDLLAVELDRADTRVVGCFNYTGTPYVGQYILPQVVYAYGLQAAIASQYLKRPTLHGYSNPRSTEFVDLVIQDFLNRYQGKRYEGMLPKLAFFAARIDDLQTELRPAVEAALSKHGVPADRILVNVGDEKLTSDEDIREFNQLDSTKSTKQFVLLVGKGREGWNCRSLFGVALFRRPRSKIFVLQATMRCLRSITDAQQTGSIYLSKENIQILDDELQQNFRLSVGEFTQAAGDRKTYDVHVSTPVDQVKLTRVRKQYQLEDKPFSSGLSFGLDEIDTEPYRLIHIQREGLDPGRRQTITEDLSDRRRMRTFTELTLVAEVARYLNRPCLEIQEILAQTEEGIAGILEHINQFNELLYDCVIPRLFRELYHITESQDTEEYTVGLVKVPEEGYYQVTAAPDMVAHRTNVEDPDLAAKSFHLDPYCFDSEPERLLFWDLLHEQRVERLYFTGMLTHGQSDFYVQYIDPESHTLRSYYPDFLFKKQDGSYVIVEVKRADKIEDAVVQAKKEFAEQMAAASGMTYQIIKGSDAKRQCYDFLLSEVPSGGDRPQQQLDLE